MFLEITGVYIAGTAYLAPDPGHLPKLFDIMVHDFSMVEDVYQRSFLIFLNMARNQYFHDVNKRMERFVMSGLLLSEGYPTISIPAKRQLEFNQKMLRFYESDDMKEMIKFLCSCMDDKIINIMKHAG